MPRGNGARKAAWRPGARTSTRTSSCNSCSGRPQPPHTRSPAAGPVTCGSPSDGDGADGRGDLGPGIRGGSLLKPASETIETGCVRLDILVICFKALKQITRMSNRTQPVSIVSDAGFSNEPPRMPGPRSPRPSAPSPSLGLPQVTGPAAGLRVCGGWGRPLQLLQLDVRVLVRAPGRQAALRAPFPRGTSGAQDNVPATHTLNTCPPPRGFAGLSAPLPSLILSRLSSPGG